MSRYRLIHVTVALTVALSTAPTYARSDNGPTSPATGGLSVASDPAGAAVYLDGQLAGETPFKTDAVSAGDHRVKIVKNGYLENARIVSVTAGKPSDLSVKLTPDRPGSSTSAAPAKSGGSNKWLWIAIAGGGGAAAVILATRGGGHAPVVQTPTASVTIQIVGINVTFGVQASDADNDPLTYAWDFGDTTTGTGAAPVHAYATAGTFIAKVVVDDAHGHKVTSNTVTVTVKSLTGTWKGTLASVDLTTVILTQTGTNFAGTYSDTLIGSGTAGGGLIPQTGVITMTIQIAGNVCTGLPCAPFVFTGTASGDGNTLTGVANQSGFNNTPWTMTRQ